MNTKYKITIDLNTYIERKKHKNQVCLYCGNEFEPKHKKQMFCSLSCAASYNNTKRDRKNNEYRKKLSESLKKYHKEHPKKTKNDIILVNGKAQRICPICGNAECKRDGICKHTTKFFKNFACFGFNLEYLGTNKIFEEYERVKNLLKKEYFDNHLSPADLKEKYHYPKTYENINHLLKTIGIKTRNLSTSQKNAILVGKNTLARFRNNNNFKFKQGWHTTWGGNKIFYRSGAELKYALYLDENNIPYEVETLRIEYYDSINKCNKIAMPDFLLTQTNEIVEVKSRITFCLQNMIDKFKKYKELGYIPKLLYEGVMYSENEIEAIKEYNFILNHPSYPNKKSH